MDTPIKLKNTRTRKEEIFNPLLPGRVGIYSCGPTVYNYAHIGNLRTYIFADVLRRMFEYFGYKVSHVMNITDVGHLTSDADEGEDKLELGAQREKLSAWQIAEKYTQAFFDHTSQLNIVKPTIICKATDHIPEQIALIQKLEANGFTYKTGDGIYFDTSKFPRYGEMAKLDIEGLESGKRVGQGDKRNKTDFALWKFSPAGANRAMEWDAPWGRGFPGWHIECSAMSMKYLGNPFDIHTGGIDHIPVHHTNEIAQSECATGITPFVNIWLHAEFLVLGDDIKMSKSKGNILTVDTLIEKGFDPLAYRYYCLSSHYRKPLTFSWEALKGAATGLERLRDKVQACPRLSEADRIKHLNSKSAQKYLQNLTSALADDLGMPEIIANLWILIDDQNLAPEVKSALVSEHDRITDLSLWKAPIRETLVISADIQALVDARDTARKTKQWKDSDRLRGEISALGFEILDTPDGQKLKKK